MYMTRQRGVVVLVVLLMALLCVWWGLQKFPLHSAPITAPMAPESTPLTIRHTKTAKNHQYSGELNMRLCDSFSTQVQTTNGETAEITLAFIITEPPSCSGTPGPAPFTILFSSSKQEVPKLKSVLVNTAPIPFVVVEE